MCDLDSNGKLSQEELSLHSTLTSDVSLPDEEWGFIGDTVGFEKGELTKEGFMQLYILEGRQKEVDLNDIASRLFNMGFNAGLKIDHSCPYVINIASEVDTFEILLGEIYKLKTAEAFIFQLMEAKGNKKQVKSLEMITFYEYHNDFWSAIGVENSSRNDLELEMNCSKSENCLSNVNGREMKSEMRVKAGKSKIGMFLTANNLGKEWIVRCSASA